MWLILEIWRMRETCSEWRKKWEAAKKELKEEKMRLEYMSYDILKGNEKKREKIMKIMQICENHYYASKPSIFETYCCKIITTFSYYALCIRDYLFIFRISKLFTNKYHLGHCWTEFWEGMGGGGGGMLLGPTL
jgi:hypothetical protein